MAVDYSQYRSGLVPVARTAVTTPTMLAAKRVNAPPVTSLAGGVVPVDRAAAQQLYAPALAARVQGAASPPSAMIAGVPALPDVAAYVPPANPDPNMVYASAMPVPGSNTPEMIATHGGVRPPRDLAGGGAANALDRLTALMPTLPPEAQAAVQEAMARIQAGGGDRPDRPEFDDRRAMKEDWRTQKRDWRDSIRAWHEEWRGQPRSEWAARPTRPTWSGYGSGLLGSGG